MRTKVIWVATIDHAAEEIINALKEDAGTTRTASSRNNVIYFDGWDGLGASAVLRAVARRLTSTSPAGPGLEFEQVIHIDCSKWESRRALQRAVAEQLELPDQVMEMFDKQDEADDFRGVKKDSRTEVQQVGREMHRHVQKMDRRFLVIFHNGSSDEVDLASLCGFPLTGYSTNKVLWTFQGRFRLKPRMKDDKAMQSAGMTDVFISIHPPNKEQEELWRYLLHQEAEELVSACKIDIASYGIIQKPTQVAECLLYMLELCSRGSQGTHYDLSTHRANYWVCDGIISHRLQQRERDVSATADDAVDDDDDDDVLWRAADALQHEMPLDVDYYQHLSSSHVARYVKSKPYWSSPAYGLTRVPDAYPDREMFQHYSDKLSVLKLSHCTFNFQSPPFLCCQSLRFLWLDHCQDIGITADGARQEEEIIRRCFQRLWVLDVRYTCCDQILSTQMMDLMTQLKELNVMGALNWDMGQLQGRLPNVRKLRVTKSTVCCSCSEDDLLSEMNKMELLEFSENRTNESMMRLSGPGISRNNSCLETAIVQRCPGLRHISFRGYTKLKNLFLSSRQYYSWPLYTLDITGTAVKTLDLTAFFVTGLRELCILDCENLCAILWPEGQGRELREGLFEGGRALRDSDKFKLYIDTTQSASTACSRGEKTKGSSGIAIAAATESSSSSAATAAVLQDSRRTSEFDWYISVRDARLLASLETMYSDSRKTYVEVSSSPASPCSTAGGGGSKDKGIKSGGSTVQQLLVSLQRQPAPAIYADITFLDHQQQATEGDGDAPGIMQMWPCPDAPHLSPMSCYMHIQDQMGTKSPRGREETSTIDVPEFVARAAKILHVHNSLSITSIPSTTIYLGSDLFYNLEWCRIERCPQLEHVFCPKSEQTMGSFLTYSMRTLWASKLPKAHYIYKRMSSSSFYRTFPYLTLLHQDFCPRLRTVLPFSKEFEETRRTFPNSLCELETVEITWCGDLTEIFPLDIDVKWYVERQLQPVTLDLPKLKCIHLHELPMLRHICELRLSAPNLETVKIRGCWSLRCLPVVDGSGNKVVECDCEKEWWDRLEWEDDSHKSNYKPIYCRFYKKTMLRGSVLR